MNDPTDSEDLTEKGRIIRMILKSSWRKGECIWEAYILRIFNSLQLIKVQLNSTKTNIFQGILGHALIFGKYPLTNHRNCMLYMPNLELIFACNLLTDVPLFYYLTEAALAAEAIQLWIISTWPVYGQDARLPNGDLRSPWTHIFRRYGTQRRIYKIIFLKFKKLFYLNFEN